MDLPAKLRHDHATYAHKEYRYADLFTIRFCLGSLDRGCWLQRKFVA
jgi:hypothetical protein